MRRAEGEEAAPRRHPLADLPPQASATRAFVQGDRLRHPADYPRCIVILQPLANTLQVMADGDADGAQMVGRTDPRDLQQLR